MEIEIDEEISTERNPSEGHSVDAVLTLSFDGKEIGTASVRCDGLAGCGESFCSDVHFEGIPEWLRSAAGEAVREAACDEIRDWWDYNGSEWSEPVDEPDADLEDQPDDDHQWAVVGTAFHGKGVKGYAVSEESAEEWVAFLTSGTDCVCGCYGVVAVSDIESLPTNDGQQRDPYCLQL